jgi:GcrA cell cycle regulator
MLKLKPGIASASQMAPAFTPHPGNIACPCQVIDLESRSCRWPFGDPQQPGFYFCGAVIAGDGPYCPTHRPQAYNATHREMVR